MDNNRKPLDFNAAKRKEQFKSAVYEARNRFNRMEYKLRRFAIPNLMLYVVVSMGAVFVLELLGMPAANWFYFNRALILRGQVWRLVTFLAMPPSSSLLFILLSLYFYWMIGTQLENQWGSYKFNLFYFIGMLCAWVGGFIAGVADNQFLNLSLFLAFAAMFPEFQVMLFFILPIKMKYLAYIDLAFLAYQFLTGTAATRWLILLSLVNIALFFGGDLWAQARMEIGTIRRRMAFRRNYRR